MMQIKLKTVDGHGGAAKSSSLSGETVRVACPDHLVLADLPVAKNLGAVTATASSSRASIGHRGRRLLGEKVHFCVLCDFPIAIYGRLIPCNHTFCLTCASNDSSCILCDERIQKIEKIKHGAGIFVCGFPHCLKSYVLRSEFVSHMIEAHVESFHPNAKLKGGGSETEPPSLTDHAPPPRSSFLPHRHLSRDQPPPRLHPRPPPPPPNYPHPLATAPFSYSSLPTDESQPSYGGLYEMPHSGTELGSVLGIPPGPGVMGSFMDNVVGPRGRQFFPPMQLGQGGPQEGGQFLQGGDYGLMMNPLQGTELDSIEHGDGMGLVTPCPLLSPPPPLRRPI